MSNRNPILGSVLLLVVLAACSTNESAGSLPTGVAVSNDLSPGTKIKGWVTFEVPEAATTFMLVYAPGFASEPVEVALN